MFDSIFIDLLHRVTGWLLEPVLVLLAITVVLVVWESGIAVGERSLGLRSLRRASPRGVEALARRRIDRADLLARSAPMLGLMGTLIPLGPGLSALGNGDLEVLATAVTVAFDTTVIGLLAGMVSFIIGRLRRRWYDELLDALEGTDATA
jgi:biopolymer transport protein ExbB/TolQ